MEKLPKRFTDAVTKLYTAFHNNELNAMECAHCAVGNICDNSYRWDELGILKETDLFQAETATRAIGKMYIIKRTYKNGSSRITSKKIMY